MSSHSFLLAALSQNLVRQEGWPRGGGVRNEPLTIVGGGGQNWAKMQLDVGVSFVVS